ncbi:MAG TPA: membrane dipeptidase, partial [Vicinamibacteria bacterium]
MKRYAAIFVLMVFSACRPETADETESAAPTLSHRERAEQLAQELLIVDTHIDVPDRLTARMEDISARTEHGDFDYVRAKEGGLNVAFMSIYIPAGHQDTGGAKEVADRLIDMVDKFAIDWPDKFAIATSVAEVRQQA